MTEFAFLCFAFFALIGALDITALVFIFCFAKYQQIKSETLLNKIFRGKS